MYFDPDAPRQPGEPDYSKGCMQDLPEDMQPEMPPQPDANTLPPAQAPPAPAPSTTSAPAPSSSSGSVLMPPLHSPSPPSPSLLESYHAVAPSHGGLPSSDVGWLTAVSPVMSVLYLSVLAVLLASFYFLPHRRTRPSQSQPNSHAAKAALTNLLSSLTPTTTSSSSPSPSLSSSPSTSPYLQHASSIPVSISSHFSPLELSHAIRCIVTAFDEDIHTGDISTLSTIPLTSTSTAHFLVKQPGTLSGTALVDLVFHLFDPTLTTHWLYPSSTPIPTPHTVVGTVTGPTRSLLTSERVALNFLQRSSGIATHTALLTSIIHAHHSSSLLLDTRKTVPGLRMLDKMAVRDGGGRNHRIGLYDMVMIKDNHITAAGGIPQAVRAVQRWCREQGREDVPVEVETRTLDEVRTLLSFLKEEEGGVGGEGGANGVAVTRVMLDNMVKVRRGPDGEVQDVDVSMLKAAVAMLQADERGRRLESEASGNVGVDTIGRIAESQVTFISVGAITHSVTALDISLKIQ